MPSRFFQLILITALCRTIAVGAPSPAPKYAGNLRVAWLAAPSSLLYYRAYDDYSQSVTALVFDTLCYLDPSTLEIKPRLATKWTFSKDRREIKLSLNPTAKFSDGEAVTSKDVVFTLKTLKKATHRTVPFQDYFSSIKNCEASNPHTVLCHLTPHPHNLEKLTNLYVLPEHRLREKDFNTDLDGSLVGSGPYTVEKMVKGEYVVLRRNPEYWGNDLDINRGRFSLERVTFRAVPDLAMQIALLKKKEIDFLYFLSSKIWATETNGPLFQSGDIRKLKVENRLPHSLVGIAWNLRRPLFVDPKVRLALSSLLDRERMIRDLFYGNYVPAEGIFHSKSPFHSPNLHPVSYDPIRATKLLKESGWNRVNDKGILVKDGKEFSFDIIATNAGSQRYLSLYQEALKRVGIQLNIRILDWVAAQELVKKREFDGFETSENRDVFPTNLAACWGSESAKSQGTCNLTGYSNPKADRTIAKLETTFDAKARVELLRTLDETVMASQPISLLWEQTYLRIAYWNDFGFEGRGYENYTNWWDIFHSWHHRLANPRHTF